LVPGIELEQIKLLELKIPTFDLSREDRTAKAMPPAICLQCREEFDSKNRLHDHIRTVCWATIHERQFPENWTLAIRSYVQRAMDPVNGEPGWSNADIVRELKSYIEAYRCVGHIGPSIAFIPPGLEAFEPPLPQQLGPKDPRYVRTGGPRPLPTRDRYVNGQITATLAPEAPKIYPEVFVDPSSPQSLFKHGQGQLFIAHRDHRELLIFTDGACSDNGQAGAQGGCSFVFRCSKEIPRPWNPPKGAYIMHGAFFFRLEDVGPSGKHEKPTSNRAELRAVVAALRYFGTETTETGLEFWKPRDSAKLVIATDSTYVVNGATKWCKAWETNGWKKSNGASVKNQDLWELLLERLRELQSTRCYSISFWHIPREQNKEADIVAKYAATLTARPKFGIPSPDNFPILVDPSQL
jgi:ribonuclease HI